MIWRGWLPTAGRKSIPRQKTYLKPSPRLKKTNTRSCWRSTEREEEEQLSLITAVDPTREQKETSKGNSPSASVAGQSLIAPLGQELTILQLVTNLVTSPTAQNQLERTDLNELAELLRGNPQQLLREQQQYTASTTTTNDSSRDLILLVIRVLAYEQGTTESDLLRALRQVRPTSNHYWRVTSLPIEHLFVFLITLLHNLLWCG